MWNFFRHLRAAFRRPDLDRRLRDEMAQHLEWKTQAYIDGGVPADEASRRAAVDVGNVTRLREDARAVWGFPTVDSLVQDVQYGIRLLRRSPGFSLVAILSLAVGIGATTAVFSLADAVLLRTMAVRDPAGVFVIEWTSGPALVFSSLNGSARQTATETTSTSFSLAAYESFRSDASRYLSVLGFADLYEVNVVVDGRAETGTAHAVSGNYFDVLGVPAAVGRTLGADDDRSGAPTAAVLSDRMWRQRFGASFDVVGKHVLINAVPFTIVGVLPAAFHGTGQVGTDPDVYVPLARKASVVPNDDPPADPNFWWVLTLGRLKPGVRAEEARGALDVLLKRTVAAAKPSLTAGELPRIQLLPGGRGQVENREAMRDPLRMMALVTAIVLLVACANVAGLLLARGRARTRELSVRVAIGAPRGRVIRQLLTEAGLVAIAGAALGVLFARWIGAALAPALSSDPRTAVLGGTNPRVLAFATATAAASAIAFGLVPAFRTTRLDVGAGLQEAGRGAIHGAGHRLLSGALVVLQIALALLLLAGAGLLVRSVRNLEHVDLGFNSSNLLLFRIDPSLNGYEGRRTTDLYTRILDRVRATPGVVAASLSSHRLISNSSSIGEADRTDEARPNPGSAEAMAYLLKHTAWRLTVDDRFFATLGIRVLRGRVFGPGDAGSGHVAIVNVSLARQLFGTDDVVGRQFRTGSFRGKPLPTEIIGVVQDSRYASVRRDSPPTMYLYYRQLPEMKNAPTFYVRTAGPPASIAASVRDIVREIDANLPVDGLTTQADQIATSLRQERLFARLATLLGAVAVVLAAIGVYGVLAYGVARRTPEIGLRMALGAARGRVLWLILRESLLLAVGGLLAGVPLALAGTTVLASMLFGLAPRDPATLGAATLSMLVLAAFAGYIPARRAARVDPLVALRTQ